MTDTLRRATRVHARGHWPAEREAGTVTLAFDDRHRRRMVMTDDAGPTSCWTCRARSRSTMATGWNWATAPTCAWSPPTRT
ncbi:hypothetical protein [Azospirillum brasilense]|uniref:hypothetical protein n=1 Tax=Azospirillum brasilense TaxID=192 RepID=UPI001FFFF1C1|nr:hypothetical protein [Azospirillum brasilense]